MSIIYCDYCDICIDTDYNTEHFYGAGNCIQQEIDKWEEAGYNEDQIESMLNELD